MPEQVHVIGAGLAGLAAAVEIVAAGTPVTLYEQAGHAGGRCRSFDDEKLGRTIDNGNHLILSGNTSVQRYLARIGASDRLTGPDRAAFPFIDIASGERWTLRPGASRLPWWILSSRRRIPGTHLADYLAAWRLLRAQPGETVTDCVGRTGAMFHRFWEPLTIAVLNTAPHEASASLLGAVLRETFGKGEAACRPRIAAVGLGHCFVTPALDWLSARRATCCFHVRIRALDIGPDGLHALACTDGRRIEIGRNDAVVLAVPPTAAADLLPGLRTPAESRAIVNAHFRLPEKVAAATFVGLIGSAAQWVFVRDDVASVTVSAADDLAAEGNEAVAGRLWPDVCRALRLADLPLPTARVIREKRATFAQTPRQLALRPACRTSVRNLVLAGDWTDTGLPATIEGSVRSGHTAAASLLADAITA